MNKNKKFEVGTRVLYGGRFVEVTAVAAGWDTQKGKVVITLTLSNGKVFEFSGKEQVQAWLLSIVEQV